MKKVEGVDLTAEFFPSRQLTGGLTSGHCHRFRNLRCLLLPPSPAPFTLGSTAWTEAITGLPTLHANASGLVAARSLTNVLVRARKTAFPRAHITTFRMRKHKLQGWRAYPEGLALAVAPLHCVKKCRSAAGFWTCGNAVRLRRLLWRWAQVKLAKLAHAFLPKRQGAVAIFLRHLAPVLEIALLPGLARDDWGGRRLCQASEQNASQSLRNQRQARLLHDLRCWAEGFNCKDRYNWRSLRRCVDKKASVKDCVMICCWKHRQATHL